MRMETFIRKALGLKAHYVAQLEQASPSEWLAHVERRGQRRLRCGTCGREVGRVAAARRPPRRWRDLALHEQPLVLVYAPYRVWCPHCGLRVERVPRTRGSG